MITIRIETDNSAFENRGEEVSRILRKLASRYENEGGCDGIRLIDYNGNICGDVTDERPDCET